jgi:phage terminase Nu1 subunit (DNA packaging protein)
MAQPQPEPLELTMQQAAAFVGVSYNSMTNYLNSAYPPPRQANKKFRSDDLGKWLVDRTERAMRVEITKDPNKLDANHELARKNKELADKTALENQVRRSELVEVDEIRTMWSLILMKVRTRLLSIPTAMAAMIAVETDQALVKEMLDEGVRDALNELVSDWTQAGDNEPSV